MVGLREAAKFIKVPDRQIGIDKLDMQIMQAKDKYKDKNATWSDSGRLRVSSRYPTIFIENRQIQKGLRYQLVFTIHRKKSNKQIRKFYWNTSNAIIILKVKKVTCVIFATDLEKIRKSAHLNMLLLLYK